MSMGVRTVGGGWEGVGERGRWSDVDGRRVDEDDEPDQLGVDVEAASPVETRLAAAQFQLHRVLVTVPRSCTHTSSLASPEPRVGSGAL